MPDAPFADFLRVTGGMLLVISAITATVAMVSAILRLRQGDPQEKRWAISLVGIALLCGSGLVPRHLEHVAVVLRAAGMAFMGIGLALSTRRRFLLSRSIKSPFRSIGLVVAITGVFVLVVFLLEIPVRMSLPPTAEGHADAWMWVSIAGNVTFALGLVLTGVQRFHIRLHKPTSHK